jgi:hypothetical protein
VSTLFSLEAAGRRLSRRGVLIALPPLLVAGGLATYGLMPRWRPPQPLPENPQAAGWSPGHPGELLTSTAEGGYRVAAGVHPGLVLLGTLKKSVYRLSTEIKLEQSVERAGLYFDLARSSDADSSSTAQALVFVRGDNDKYFLQWQRIPFRGSEAMQEHALTPVGSFHPGLTQRLEVEFGPEGVRAVRCNGELMPKEAFPSFELRNSGEVGLIVFEGAAQFGPTSLRVKR